MIESQESQLRRFSKELSEVAFTIWGMTPDINDIKEGEFPIGERLARVKGFDAARAAAQGVLDGDPTIMIVFIQPDMPLNVERYFSRLKVARSIGPGANLTDLDPNEGDGPPKGTLIL